MNRTFAKSERIGQVQRLLLSSRIPLTQADIARRCQVHRSTIGRMVQGMIDEGIPLRYDDEGRIDIERTAYISTIRLRLHEVAIRTTRGRVLKQLFTNRITPRSSVAIRTTRGRVLKLC